MYSLAMVLYEIFAQKVPFAEEEEAIRHPPVTVTRVSSCLCKQSRVNTAV